MLLLYTHRVHGEACCVSGVLRYNAEDLVPVRHRKSKNNLLLYDSLKFLVLSLHQKSNVAYRVQGYRVQGTGVIL